MRSAEFNDEERNTLLTIARLSIVHGLRGGGPGDSLPEVAAALRDPRLAAERASFVTLTEHGILRGCIGSLEARQPLALDVARNAYSSAFRDPRFPPLDPGEIDDLHIEIAVLSAPRRIEIGSEQDLLNELEPHIDGLVIDDGRHRATFLPKVWESLPQPERFLSELKRKAGLPVDYWSNDIKAYRYHCESFAEDSFQHAH